MPSAPASSGPAARSQAAFLAQVNGLIAPRGQVAAYAILPAALWSGPYGAFLSQSLGHTPDQPWNTMLLAADAASARGLGLPRVPDAYPEGLFDAAQDWVARLSGRVMDAQRASAMNPAEAQVFRCALKSASDDLFAFAHASAVKQFGEPAYQAHLALFGDLLRWEHRARFLKIPLPASPGDGDGAHQIAAAFSGPGAPPGPAFLTAGPAAYSAQLSDRLSAAALQRQRLVEAVNERLAPQAMIATYDIIPPCLWDEETCDFLTGTLNVYPQAGAIRCCCQSMRPARRGSACRCIRARPA